jgi:hypothetical protein
MSKQRISPRTLSDAYTKARSKGAKPARVSFIVGGVKYKSGVAPAQVCPPPRVARGTMARMVPPARPSPLAGVVAASRAAPKPQAAPHPAPAFSLKTSDEIAHEVEHTGSPV